MPRLVVVISIDQFRADYLTRFVDSFVPPEKGGAVGGLRFLMERGAWFANCQYEHLPLYTGPSHAVILTGAFPCKTGIIGNQWWDHSKPGIAYCVGDSQCDVIGAAPGSRARPMGPRNLRSTTVGDELKLATVGRARVVSIALKDRAAILLGGHAQDVCLWYDATGGRWISSTAFCRDGKLPAWVAALNDEHIPDKTLGAAWTPIVGEKELATRTLAPRLIGGDLPPGMGERFPHPVGAEKTAANYRAFMFTPDANAFVFQTAERAITAEALGQDDVPDLLAFNLSTNDFVGHCFGPYSPEVMDLSVQTDRQLSGFMNFLASRIPGGLRNVVIVVTADHGVCPTPEDVAGPPFNIESGRYSTEAVTHAIEAALTERFGAPAGGSWFAHDPHTDKVNAANLDGLIYFDPDSMTAAIRQKRALSQREFEQVARDAVNLASIRGVYACYGKTQILEGAVADNELRGPLAHAIFPARSGDLLIIPDQFFVADPQPEEHATTHGTPYMYDTHVPLLIYAPGRIASGKFVERVSPSAIAPTLSLMLNIEFPSGCDGQPLREIDEH